MANYRQINSSETDVNSPVTTNLAVALAENPVAIAEGNPNAPRISPRGRGVTNFHGDAVGTLILSDFSPYGGAYFDLFVVNSAVAAGTVGISFSTDGATYNAAVAVITGISNTATGRVFVDFSDGTVRSVYFSDTAGSFTHTAPGVSGGISHVRFTQDGTSTLAIAAMANVNSGIVA